MNIGLVDADLIGRNKHNFPNLALEKIASFHMQQGAHVSLITDLSVIPSYDKVYIAKVFTDTPFNNEILSYPNVIYGGTGFFFDKAEPLTYDIEHTMPYYDLYKDNMKQFHTVASTEYYKDYSIGFLTRGCFRKCPFCVNQKYDKVMLHSPVEEFLDRSRKKLCFLDDNFLGYIEWESILKHVISLNKPFVFKQGLDIRLLTDKVCDYLTHCRYDKDFIFAFDRVKDYDLIKSKLDIMSKYKWHNNIRFYVLVGFESIDIEDIENAFKRVHLLQEYGCIPYIMRYQNKNDTPWKRSKYKQVYIELARWCNQPSFYKKKSFREYCVSCQSLLKRENIAGSSMRALNMIDIEYPEISKKYFDNKFKNKLS